MEELGDVFQSKYRTVFDEFFKFISPSEKRVLDDIIVSALYVQAVKEYEHPSWDPNEITIGVSDILPELTEEDIRRGESGYPVAIPESIRSIDFGHELQVIFDTFYEIVTVDPEFIRYIFQLAGQSATPASSEATSQPDASQVASEIMTKMITSLLEHKDQVEHWIDGKEAEGTSAEDTCLFDSNLLINAVPKILALMEVSMNDALSSLPGSNTISLDDIIAEFKAEATVDAKKEAAKTETQAMFSILSPLLDSEEGKELIKNFEEMPGIYYDPKGNFLGAKEGLLKALANCVRNIDNSKIFSTVVPPFVSGFLTGDDSPLKELFGDDIVIDTNCVDSTGKSIVGREFAKLIDVLADCQDVIGFAYFISIGFLVIAAKIRP